MTRTITLLCVLYVLASLLAVGPVVADDGTCSGAVPTTCDERCGYAFAVAVDTCRRRYIKGPNARRCVARAHRDAVRCERSCPTVDASER
jgi:hypothetical protein